MVRFLHTADLQLGMSRRFLGAEAQARYAQARLDSLRSIGDLARSSGAEFVVVAGDVFESNLVERATLERALDALAEIPVPVFLLPGNHDPLDATALWRSRGFAARCPANVRVLTDAEPVLVRPGVEVVGAPWPTKRPLADLASLAIGALPPSPGVTRVLVAHGAIDAFVPERRDPSLIGLAALETALSDGRISFVALGDRHSCTEVGGRGRIWYAGTPEPTDFDEVRPGEVLLVELDGAECTVTPQAVNRWHFVALDADVNGSNDIAALDRRLDALAGKATSVVRLSLRGALSLADRARLDGVLDTATPRFASLEVWEQSSELVVVPDLRGADDIGLSGFVAATADELADDASPVATDALRLLYRLAQRAA